MSLGSLQLAGFGSKRAGKGGLAVLGTMAKGDEDRGVSGLGGNGWIDQLSHPTAVVTLSCSPAPTARAWLFGRQTETSGTQMLRWNADRCKQLRRAIDDFVVAYNQKAVPFEWRKAVVFPSAPKRKYADLCN
jgi:hypothetical protein